jgi:orotate phosphoribosyltransferase
LPTAGRAARVRLQKRGTIMTRETSSAGCAVARILLEIEAVHFRPREPFKLTSGRLSPVYIDCRKIIGFPRARAKVIDLAVERVHEAIGFERLDVIAGGETAGIPYAAWIAERLALPMVYIRKQPKGFGRGAQIEGHWRDGDRMLLVEDLATDGVTLHGLATWWDVIAAAEESGALSGQDLAAVRRFLEAPEGWTA